MHSLLAHHHAERYETADTRGETVVDVVLSSGFLAFAEQAGFLAALEDLGVEVDGICGTSSGALAGALWAAGMPAEQVLQRLTDQQPLRYLRPTGRFWRGAFRLDRMIFELRHDLPARFEDLERPFGVGVIDEHRRPWLLTRGPLPEAVTASCAIPRLFRPIELHGRSWADAGVVERTSLSTWRAQRGQPVLLHLIEASSQGADPDPGDAFVVRSPRSGAKLWNLGDVRSRFENARANARQALEQR